jgi:hypothetical protein
LQFLVLFHFMAVVVAPAVILTALVAHGQEKVVVGVAVEVV